MSKLIRTNIGSSKYDIIYDGHQFKIYKDDSDIPMDKYPSTFNRVLTVICKDQLISSSSKDVLSIKEFVDQFDKLLDELKNLNYEELDVLLKSNAKIKNAGPKNKKDPEINSPIQEGDDDL